LIFHPDSNLEFENTHLLTQSFLNQNNFQI
ncbi:unnamed protein product, partial [marine sediment metagenome]